MATHTAVDTAHHFDPTILRSYDIRGQVGKTLSATDAYFIGASFGLYVQEKTLTNNAARIAVGRDGRLTSPELAKALIKGACFCWLSGHRYRCRANTHAVFCGQTS